MYPQSILPERYRMNPRRELAIMEAIFWFAVVAMVADVGFTVYVFMRCFQGKGF